MSPQKNDITKQLVFDLAIKSASASLMMPPAAAWCKVT